MGGTVNLWVDQTNVQGEKHFMKLIIELTLQREHAYSIFVQRKSFNVKNQKHNVKCNFTLGFRL